MKQQVIAGLTIVAGIAVTVTIGLTMWNRPQTRGNVNQNTLRSSVSAPIETLDSTTYGSLGASDVISGSNVGLYWHNAKGRTVPAISNGHPQISANHLRYVFTLRHYEWSDGSPVTAADFVYAWRRLASPATKARNATRVDMLANGYAVRTGKLPLSALGVKALGSDKLQVKLSVATPYIDQLLARTSMLPIKRSFAAKLGRHYGDSSAHVLADGPYIVRGWNGPKDTRWRYVKNPRYPQHTRVRVRHITFQVVSDPTRAVDLYHDGKLDYVALDPQQLQTYTGNRNLHYNTTTTAAYLFFNTKAGATANVHLRRAIGMAYNKNLLVKGTLGVGTKVLNGLIPAGLASSPQGGDYRLDTGQLLPFNAYAANQQWQLAKQQLHTTSLRIPLLIADNDTAVLTADFLKHQIEHNLPGVSIDIHKTSLTHRIALEERDDFRMVFAAWTPADGDPYNVLAFNQSDNKQNVANFSDRDYDAQLAKITSTYNLHPTARWRAIQRAERLVATKDVPTAGVFQYGMAYLLSSRVRRFPVMPSGTIIYEDVRLR